MRIPIQNPHGLKLNVDTVRSDKNRIQVSLVEFPNKIVDVPMSMDSFASRWLAWREEGLTVDEAFKELPIAIRDFFQTGVHPSEWATLLSETDIAERSRAEEYEQYLQEFPLNDPRD